MMNPKQRKKKNGDVAKVVGQYKAIGGRSANDRLSKGLKTLITVLQFVQAKSRRRF
jgi:hypothetical protein